METPAPPHQLVELAYLQRFGEALPRAGERTVSMLTDCSGAPILERLAHLRTQGDPRQIVSNWARLCARLLGLGWAGEVYGPDNLSLPAGLRSLVRLQPLRELPLTGAEEAIQGCLQSLAEGVAFYLGAPRAVALEPVRREVYQNCLEQAEAGFLLPPPLLQAVLQRPAFDLIVDRLR